MSTESCNNNTKIPIKSLVFTLIVQTLSNGILRLFPSNEQIANDLVWAIQQEAVQSLLEDNYNFILPLEPYKSNHETVKRWEHCQFLSSLVEVLQSDESSVMDINIVPMSITYDLKYEDLFDSSAKSLLKSTLYNATKLLVGILYPGSKGCGQVRLDFDQPFSLKEFIKNTDNNKYWDALGIDGFVQNLHNHVLWNSFNLRRFSACDTYSFIKFNKQNQNEVHTFKRLIADIRAKHRDVAFSGDSLSIAKYASKLTSYKGLERSLSSVIHMYLGEMVISSAICALLKTAAISCYKGTNAQIMIGSKQNLLDEAELLINLVEYEFPLVTPPCKDSVEYFLLESFDNFTGNNPQYYEDLLAGISAHLKFGTTQLK